MIGIVPEKEIGTLRDAGEILGPGIRTYDIVGYKNAPLKILLVGDSVDLSGGHQSGCPHSHRIGDYYYSGDVKMTLKEIRGKAKALGIKNYSKLKKDGLIRRIQQTEGNSPCFKGVENCGELNCAWRDDCQN